tara:strand:+ start:3660 stop:4667 length:1008 start_codon:yes stop_codon:yes gene_type:complete
MGFLDNSGDIILDAVLTDIGRKRMAEGNFRIVKFALGDDEIDYSLYNPNHASGSAYYDLEILQSPVMEAATKRASSIKYGLMSITRTDLVYMPTLKVNEKSESSLNKLSNMYYLAVNAETHENLLDNNTNGAKNFLEPNTPSPSRALVVETGIDTTERQATLENRQASIVQTGLLDLNFEVRFDNRFLAGIMSLQGGKFANLSDGTSDIILNNYVARSAVSATDFIEDYSMSIAQGIPNQVAKRGTDTTGNNLSEFQGPRGSVTAMSFMPSLEINAEGSSTPSYYTLYGSSGQAASALGLAGSNTYDTIDTTVYVRGLSSGTQLQVPLRLIRKKS